MTQPTIELVRTNIDGSKTWDMKVMGRSYRVHDLGGIKLVVTSLAGRVTTSVLAKQTAKRLLNRY